MGPVLGGGQVACDYTRVVLLNSRNSRVDCPLWLTWAKRVGPCAVNRPLGLGFDGTAQACGVCQADTAIAGVSSLIAHDQVGAKLHLRCARYVLNCLSFYGHGSDDISSGRWEGYIAGVTWKRSLYYYYSVQLARQSACMFLHV